MPWILFNAAVLLMLVADLFIFHRTAHEVKFREAIGWSIMWIVLALLFNALIYIVYGQTAALQFLTGYLLEKSLSVDNLFVFLVIFTYFKVPHAYQHRVLFWGILGALVMRAIFIFCGIALMNAFNWMVYVFGAILVFTGIKLITEKDKEVNPEKNIVLRIFRKLMPVTPGYHQTKFICHFDGRLMATPLLAVLVVIETTDVIFALDSIPAVLSITKDSFIVYTSNVFAILGLRALYFALAGFMQMFHRLHYGLGAVLIFAGVKMLIEHIYHVPIVMSLLVITGILAVSVALSVLYPEKGEKHQSSAH